MVKASLKKVFIKNFKSLHDCEIDIGKLNVVVGANASGKSNLVEVFRLLKKIYIEKDPFPFLEWWGYNNVVWQRKEELPIIIGLLFDIEGYDVYFETNFTGTGGRFQILREVLDIRDYLKFEKKGEWITIKHDIKYIDSLIEKLQEYNENSAVKMMINEQKNNFRKVIKFRYELETRLLNIILDMVQEIRLIGNDFEISTDKILYQLMYVSLEELNMGLKGVDFSIISPTIHCNKEDFYQNKSIYEVASKIIHYTLNKQLILYPLNIRLMKNPQPLRREEIPTEDGTNIASVYHTIYLKPEYRQFW